MKTPVFAARHLGLRPADVDHMLDTLGLDSLEALMGETLPGDIRQSRPLDLPEPVSEQGLQKLLAERAAQNKPFRSFLGMGYSGCITPPVILRNVLENPGWYTAYTPYQAEISQGRLEALLNFQQLVIDLTGMPVAGASLLDEGTAAAEAMAMFAGVTTANAPSVFFVSDACHPQTIDIVRTRAEPKGIQVLVGNPDALDFDTQGLFGALLQYPGTDGAVTDPAPFIDKAHRKDIRVAVAADLMSLVVLKPPGEMDADVVVGSAQRFGVPMGYGGPHAAFFATKSEYTRKMPGRLIGVSKDASGKQAYRMALQTREQHIRREKATSNICTAQVLLAIVSSMYAVYHGPDGLREIAKKIARQTDWLARTLDARFADPGFAQGPAKLVFQNFFDTLCVQAPPAQITLWLSAAKSQGINLRQLSEDRLTISLDEQTENQDLVDLAKVFGIDTTGAAPETETIEASPNLPPSLVRATDFLTHPVFNSHHSETEMLRYLRHLEQKDIALNRSMIPLGSCTMKLNATSEMMPVTAPAWNQAHPFAPTDQNKGYSALFDELERWLCEITGFDAVSLQPNAGSQGNLPDCWPSGATTAAGVTIIETSA